MIACVAVSGLCPSMQTNLFFAKSVKIVVIFREFDAERVNVQELTRETSDEWYAANVETVARISIELMLQPLNVLRNLSRIHLRFNVHSHVSTA